MRNDYLPPRLAPESWGEDGDDFGRVTQHEDVPTVAFRACTDFNAASETIELARIEVEPRWVYWMNVIGIAILLVVAAITEFILVVFAMLYWLGGST
jgi:hypothetical protein